MIKRSTLLPNALLMGMALLLAAPAVAQGDGETKSLSQKSIRKWEFTTPTEAWTAIGKTIPIAIGDREGFPVANHGTKLQVDTNGDGKVDQVIKGVGGLLQLKGKTSEGKKFSYTVRIRKQGEGWQYSTSGVMAGKIKGAKVQLLDLNGNGRYDEYGTDGMIVGKSTSASYLSKVVNLKGQLFDFHVTRDGSTMTIKPFTGEAGTLNLRSGIKVNGRLESAVVQSGDFCFDLASAKKGLLVPVGEYSIVSGLVSKGSETARIRQGRMNPLVVSKDLKTELAWGMPVRAEVPFTQNGTQVKVPPAIKYYGAAGEEYFNLHPDKASPKLYIKDAETGKLVTTGRFGGC